MFFIEIFIHKFHFVIVSIYLIIKIERLTKKIERKQTILLFTIYFVYLNEILIYNQFNLKI